MDEPQSPHIFSNRGIKLEISFSTLIFERYLDFIRASLEDSADSPIIGLAISTAAGRMSSSAIVWGSLHFAIICTTLYDASKALLDIDACLYISMTLWDQMSNIDCMRHQ